MRQTSGMVTARTDPFPTDALDANRRGELTPGQRAAVRRISRNARQSALIVAGILSVAALAMVDGIAPSLPNVLRVPIAGACLLLAAFFLLRGVVGGDPLTRDLRQGVVQSIDGAIGKRVRGSSGRSSTRTHWLDVGDKTLRVSRAGYDAAPDAGIVRVYFLPRSARVVNLERLPDRAASSVITSGDLVSSLGAALGSHSHREINEIRASMAPFSDIVRATRAGPPSPPAAEARDSRPLDEAILGSWWNPMMSVDFSDDGSVTATMFGGVRRGGHWSVDDSGRLRADVTGHSEAMDAWIASDQLTISSEGKALTFNRRAIA